MSAFPNTGRSDWWILDVLSGCFRPGADIAIYAIFDLWHIPDRRVVGAVLDGQAAGYTNFFQKDIRLRPDCKVVLISNTLPAASVAARCSRLTL
jgi:hypothetical protein